MQIIKRPDEEEYEADKLEELGGQVTDLEAQVHDLNKRMATVATKPAKEVKPPQPDFQATVSEIRKRDNCSRTEALTRARIEHPDRLHAFREGNANTEFEALAKDTRSNTPGHGIASRCSNCAHLVPMNGTAEKCENCGTPITYGKAADVVDFMAAVDATMIQKKLNRCAAMEDVRKTNPQLFEKYQEI
jgi:rubrerythrin